MTSESKQLDPTALARWHTEFEVRLKAFLLGILRDTGTAEEAFQTTFTKALTHGGAVENGKEKAWLFQVAFNEAMAIKRRAGVDGRALKKLKHQSIKHFLSDDELLKNETAERVRTALKQLPDEQRQIVELRIQEDKTFQEIANSLKQPLGTVLTRMRSALANLRDALQHD